MSDPIIPTIVRRIADRHRLRLDVVAEVIQAFVFGTGTAVEKGRLKRCPECSMTGAVWALDPAGSMSDAECPTCKGYGVVDA